MQPAVLNVLAERPSRPQLRFEQRYAEALRAMHLIGFRWEVGPVEPLPPNEHHFPRLARLVAQNGQPWRWISVSHVRAGLLGQWALFYEGNVRDESGRGLSVPALMTWSGRELEQAARRITHQNRINTAINQQLRVKVRRELPWVRAGAIAASLSAVVATGVCRAVNDGIIRTRYEYLPGLMFFIVIVTGMASSVLMLRWWYVRRWLAQREQPAD